jgi:hypothetical protein
LHKHLEGKRLIAAILILYTATHSEMIETLDHTVQEVAESKENSMNTGDGKGIPQMTRLHKPKNSALARVTKEHMPRPKLRCPTKSRNGDGGGGERPAGAIKPDR